MGEYEFDVKMSCKGCSGAVERALSKAEGVTAYSTNLANQKVLVTANVPYEIVLDKIKNTGKVVSGGRVLSA